MFLCGRTLALASLITPAYFVRFGFEIRLISDAIVSALSNIDPSIIGSINMVQNFVDIFGHRFSRLVVTAGGDLINDPITPSGFVRSPNMSMS